VSEFPPIEHYLKRCESRPAFQAAERNQQAGYMRNAPVAA